MLKIRLQRVGRKHEPAYRLVLTDSKNSTKSGKFLEILGNYDSRRGEKAEFKAEQITHWISKGAQVSDTVHNLLVSKKIIEGKKINVLPRKKPIVKTPVVADENKNADNGGLETQTDAVTTKTDGFTSNEDESAPALGESSTETPTEQLAEAVAETVV